MTRKEFIQKSAALGIALPFISIFLESCEKDEILFPEFEVNFSGKILIIGAGAAGLTAGYLLNRYNIDFEILEASSVFGGRIKRVDNFADFPIDLGAEWIHENPSVLARLISDPNLNATIDTVKYTPDSVYNWNDNKLKKQNWGGNFYSEYKFKSTTWYGFFEKYIAPGIHDKITYDSPIVEIEYSTDKVFVKNSNNDVFEADKVLVTVPMTILQNDSINFIPSLTAQKTNAINSIDMPDGLKVFIEFSENFYPDILFTDSLISEVRAQDKLFYDAAFRKDTNKNILGLFVVGEKASAYTDLGTEAVIIAKILSELDEMFNGKATQTYIKHVVQNWSKEPYIQGSYGIDFDGSQNDIINTLKEPINNNVFFAGEALSLDNGGTVPGASESAYSVIEVMLKD